MMIKQGSGQATGLPAPKFRSVASLVEVSPQRSDSLQVWKYLQPRKLCPASCMQYLHTFRIATQQVLCSRVTRSVQAVTIQFLLPGLHCVTGCALVLTPSAHHCRRSQSKTSVRVPRLLFLGPLWLMQLA